MRLRTTLVLPFLALAPLGAFAACGSTQDSVFDDGTSGGDGDGSAPPTTFTHPDGAACQGLACQQVDCGGGGVTTTLSGVVNAPNGTLPLYNAIVYVPNAPLDPLPDGASCDRCGSVSGKPIVSTTTDVAGKFVLKNVPVGADIPLVVQVGKWRRQVKLPKVDKCVDNPVDAGLTRLPKNKSEGDIPRIAVTTGRCDQLACLLPKLGLDPAEFTPSDGNGRLHLYRGAPFPPPPDTPVPAPAPKGTLDATALWDTVDTLKKYDMVLMSCECGPAEDNKPAAAKKALYDYTTIGGRVFASHFHYVWAETAPLSTTAQWMGSPNNPENLPGPYLVDTSFPKGSALAKWLVNVGASKTEGVMPISQPRQNVGTVVSPTQRWVYRQPPDAGATATTNYLSVNSPIGKPVEQQCGKFVFADMHLYGGDMQDPATALPDDGFPGTCGKDLTNEEKALAFLFFELSSCVQDDSKPPVPIK